MRSKKSCIIRCVNSEFLIIRTYYINNEKYLHLIT